MSKPIDKSWVALTVTRIVAVATAVLAIVLIAAALHSFQDAHEYAVSADAHPDAAESEPHGLDVLAAGIVGTIGTVELVVAAVLLGAAVTAFVVASRKLGRQAAVRKVGAAGPVIAPQKLHGGNQTAGK